MWVLLLCAVQIPSSSPSSLLSARCECSTNIVHCFINEREFFRTERMECLHSTSNVIHFRASARYSTLLPQCESLFCFCSLGISSLQNAFAPFHFQFIPVRVNVFCHLFERKADIGECVCACEHRAHNVYLPNVTFTNVYKKTFVLRTKYNVIFPSYDFFMYNTYIPLLFTHSSTLCSFFWLCLCFISSPCQCHTHIHTHSLTHTLISHGKCRQQRRQRTNKEQENQEQKTQTSEAVEQQRTEEKETKNYYYRKLK